MTETARCTLLDYVTVTARLMSVLCCRYTEEDILFIGDCDCFTSQANNVLCYFNKLTCSVRIKLFKAYCNSRYGCELWSVDNACINDYEIAWRKALRRVLKFPPDTHSGFLPLLINVLPFCDDSVFYYLTLHLFVLLLSTAFLRVSVIL